MLLCLKLSSDDLSRKTYVELRWSEALKRESKVFAEVLLEECDLYHDPGELMVPEQHKSLDRGLISLRTLSSML